MNLAIDIGNTALKWALFEGRTLRSSGVAKGEDELRSQWAKQGIDPTAAQVMVAASGRCPAFDFGYTPFSHTLQLPISIGYRTPDTLGADRLADACGAWALHPGEASLIIDAGTCITVDFLDASGCYHGGAIMPGVRMNLQALHTFTDKLPLLEIEAERRAPLLGRTTEESLVAGTLGATLLALAGFVAAYRAKTPQMNVLLTGGDAPLLASGGTAGWVHVPDLTLRGINEALLSTINLTNQQ